MSWEQGEQAGGERSKLGYVILCFRVPTSSVGARESEGSELGVRGSKLGARGSELGARGGRQMLY